MTRLALLVLCLFVALPPALAKPGAEAVRIGVHPEKTRFVLELTDKPSYRVFTLPDPAQMSIPIRYLPGGIQPRTLG